MSILLLVATAVSSALLPGVSEPVDQDLKMSAEVSFVEDNDRALASYTVELARPDAVTPTWVTLSQVLRLESEDSEVPVLTTEDLLRDATLVNEFSGANVALATGGSVYEVDGEVVEELPTVTPLTEVDTSSDYAYIVILPRTTSWEADIASVSEATEDRWTAYDPLLEVFLASENCDQVYDRLLLAVPYSDQAESVTKASGDGMCSVTASFELGEEESHILAALAHRETATFYRNDTEAGVEFSPASVGDQGAYDVALTVNSDGESTQAPVSKPVKVFEAVPTTTTTTVAPVTTEAVEVTVAGDGETPSTNGGNSGLIAIVTSIVAGMAVVAFAASRRRAADQATGD